jgi:thymidylate synthase (FAD)
LVLQALGKEVKEMKQIGKGYIKYLRHSGSVKDIANCAAISYDKADAERSDHKCKTLVMRLLTLGHGSPFEQASITFEVYAPIFVLRQWMRHRIGWSYNEQSLRYTSPTSFDFYIPEALQKECTRDEFDTDVRKAHEIAMRQEFELILTDGVELYKRMVDSGIPREQARAVLPVGLYSKVIMTANLRAVIHFINLRSDKHAQAEIQKFSDALREICREITDFTPIFGEIE